MPFKGLKVYISTSLRGGLDPDFKLVQELAEYLKAKGAKILDEHVVKDKEQSFETLKRRVKEDGEKLLYPEQPWFDIRRFDTKWVDEADLLIAFVNNPSLGVGMEIERALLRVERGLKPIPIICLVRKEKLDSLSWMVRGIKEENFYLIPYENSKEIIEAIQKIVLNP